MSKQELDARYSGGLLVRLLYDPEIRIVTLEVTDELGDETFAPAVIPPGEALQALNRPLLYVSGQRTKSMA